MQIANSTPIENPLPSSRALRRSMRAPTGELRDRVTAWLSAHRWLRSAPGVLIDPVTFEALSLVRAVHLQATRDAQLVLEPRGWRMAGGTRARDQSWSDCWAVSHPSRTKACSPFMALVHEGLSAPPVKGVRRGLRLLREGRAA